MHIVLAQKKLRVSLVVPVAMAESSPFESIDEHQLLQSALDNPFEPAEVPLAPAPSASTSTSAPTLVAERSSSSENPPLPEVDWQAAYSAQVSEWRAQSASARTKAELVRAQWEAIRSREEEQREALGQPFETCDTLGQHITASSTAASETVSLSASVASLGSADVAPSGHGAQPVNTESRSPSQLWEHMSSSNTSSYPSMLFPEASVPQSPSAQPALLAPAPASAPPHQNPQAELHPTRVPPSTLPSIMDNKIAPRTRLSLILSSLAINLLLPFINGVMLGFGEIFAKDVVVGWFGWKTRSGRTAAGVGLRH